MTPTPITLQNEHLRVQLLPELGGGVARFDHLAHGRVHAIFRARADNAGADPNTLACYPLLPWSNRIGGGGFDFDGRRREVGLTRQDEPLPIHGFGAFCAWDGIEAEDASAILSLRLNRDGWDFHAWQHFQLGDDRLVVTATVHNHGPRMPFGLGLHPFLPRTGSTRLWAPATGVWLSGSDSLPVRLQSPQGERDFASRRTLPSTLTLNNGFTGWDGHAQIEYEDWRLDIRADAGCYVLYAPQGEDFFCFEPVDHPVDAFHLSGGAAANGMTILETGQTLSRRYQFAVLAS
ncbi:aldose 1-epimerase [Paludibacterium yongneupense]|uniref:aldose 1-epimerase n=1 Tax=Paludibacterium yongneupense TaxID=400061 RepID=UPI00041EED22|nr:aldose 1-epimerase [Paludibacterium yongneupense]